VDEFPTNSASGGCIRDFFRPAIICPEKIFSFSFNKLRNIASMVPRLAANRSAGRQLAPSSLCMNSPSGSRTRELFPLEGLLYNRAMHATIQRIRCLRPKRAWLPARLPGRDWFLASPAGNFTPRLIPFPPEQQAGVFFMPQPRPYPRRADNRTRRRGARPARRCRFCGSRRTTAPDAHHPARRGACARPPTPVPPHPG
jgi:hypothetical protein